MKPFLIFLLFALVSYEPAFSQSTEKLTEGKSFGTNPGNLRLFIHCPEQRNDTLQKPLVVVLHGCGQNAQDAAVLTGWNKLADLNNFIVIYPQQKFANNPGRCFNWFRNDDINKGKGECESIYRMICFMREHYPVDSTKIFITGLSAGAAMSVVMMSVHPELFRAGAIFAGGAYKASTTPMSATKVMSGKKYIPREDLIKNVVEQNPGYAGSYPELIIFQGLKDHIVNPVNTNLLINQWTGLHHCDTIPDQVDRSWMNRSDIMRSIYHDKDNNAAVIYYEIKNLGHQILVKPGDKDDEGGQTGIFGVNKNFHSTYQVTVDFGILRKQ